MVYDVHIEGLRIQSGLLALAAALVAVGLIVVFYLTDRPPSATLPVICSNPAVFATQGRKLLAQGVRDYPDGFQAKVSTGWKIFLPNRFADELRNSPYLSFNKAFASDTFIHYPGFDAARESFADDKFLQGVARRRLTPSLPHITKDLADEGAVAVQEVFGEIKDWTTHAIKVDMLELTTRMVIRVFMGKSLARAPELRRIFKTYMHHTGQATKSLRQRRAILRPFMHWFDSSCKLLRQDWMAAQSILRPEIEKKAKQKADNSSESINGIDWMLEAAEKRTHTDLVAAQLSLSISAVHTSSDTLVNCLVGLCETPEIVTPLRQEIISVLGKEGWAKAGLDRLELLDSFMKEVQRVYKMNDCSMYRFAEQAITLSTGVVIPKCSKLVVSNDWAVDPHHFENPEKLDPYRFMSLMQGNASEENKWKYVSTSAEHMGFGHGRHSCPGRFFASTLIKIALVTVLMKYDVRFVPDQGYAKRLEFETFISQSPKGLIQIKKCKMDDKILARLGLE